MKRLLRPALSFACAALMFLAPGLVSAAETNTAAPRLSETPEQRVARMKWFGEARFGMFIHWGLYAVPAGEYGGKTGYGEWIMESAKIPASEYGKYVGQFNPEKFDAREWARLAKDAGMKYLVITSKHHDGFGMYRSELTDWCIKSTPFQRDPLKELAEACKAEGITFCLYHSIMDWHHPDYEPRRAWNDTATNAPNMDRYVGFLKGELTELLTRYGPLGVLWFDGEWEGTWNTERGIEIYNHVRSLQPQIIVNNRVGRARAGMAGMDKGQGVGDYGTPEQEIPPTGFGPGVFWESCMTMNDHWGYNKHDEHWKSASTLVRNLIDCASKGGNYLLNVGPTAEGLIPGGSIERLRAIGQWTKANGEAVYVTEAGPFRKLAWGRCTQKTDGKETILYLHVFDWPADGKLFVPGLRNELKSAALLVGGEKLSAKKSADGVEIEVPSAAPDAISTTIALLLAGPPDIAEFRIAAGKNGSLLLDAVNADLSGKQLRTETMSGKSNLGFWSEAGDTAQWPIKITQSGDYEISAELSGEAVGEFTVEVDDQKLTAQTSATGSYYQYAVKSLGTLKLNAGNHTLIVRPVAEKWQPMNLRHIKLTPKTPSATSSPTSEDPRVTFANKVLTAYQADAPRNQRVLHVAYFCPTNRTLAPDYQPRLEKILGDISGFYAEQMRHYGLPSDGIPLDRDAAGKLVIHLVTGRRPASEYSEAKSADEIHDDVSRVMKSAGIDIENNHVVVFTRLGNFDGTNTSHNSPYCGMGWAGSGFCWQFDSELMAVANLTVTNKWVTDRQYGHINYGRYNSIFLGGTAHELGHCFGLPHTAQTEAELRERGHSLMGDGNRHLWEELRSDGKGSFLGLPQALALAANPLFSHVDKGVGEKWESAVENCRVEFTNGSARVTGRFKSNQPVYGVIAYVDPEGHSDYDALSYAGTVGTDNTFSIELATLPASRAPGEIHVCLLSASGQHLNASQTSRAKFAYTFDSDGRLVVQTRERSPGSGRPPA